MKTLTLLRHAKSGWDNPVLRDFDRPLNAKGARAAALIGQHMRALGLAFDHVVASPAQRVIETVEQIGSGYGRTIEPEWDRRLYLASTSMLLDLIHALPAEVDRVMLIGHNPGLEELVLLLVADNDLRREAAIKFPTATIAELQLDGTWSALLPGAATLTRFIRPRDLDPALGPDQD
ncbi:histidine phosphatase family protein [Sphingomonas koreensis]|nr:histidine phosphatase family protein [Sphingomonas koreensis]